MTAERPRAAGTGAPADRERGSALIVVATLMALVAALAAGLSLGASTVVLVAGNHAATVQTRAAADAGAEHALAAVLAVLPRWQSEGLASPALALPDLLEQGRLWRAAQAEGFPSGWQPFGGAAYTVAVVDDDAPERALGPADVAAIGEDGHPAHDANGRVVIRAVAGRAQGASATVEAVLGLVPLPAALLAGRTRIGAAALAGIDGSIHVAGDLEIDGPLVAAGPVEATGRLDAAVRPVTAARVSGWVRRVPFPEVRPEDLRARADLVLRADGGGTASSATWAFAAGTWTLTSAPSGPATVFVEGDAVLDVTGPPVEPVRLSLVATGSVLVRGAFSIRPAAGGLLIVAGRDVRIEGALDADGEEGLIAAGEQVAIVGPAHIRGNVLAAGRGHGASLAQINTIANGAVITAGGGLAAAGFPIWRVLGWHRDQAW